MGAKQALSVYKMEKVYLMSLIDLLDTSKAGQNPGWPGLRAGLKKSEAQNVGPSPA
jgi:hypothetical protein